MHVVYPSALMALIMFCLAPLIVIAGAPAYVAICGLTYVWAWHRYFDNEDEDSKRKRRIKRMYP